MKSRVQVIRRLKFLILVGVAFPCWAMAQGGPPLVTDDPATPGDGHWEINVAGILAQSSQATILDLPYVDLNYGWGDHIQLKYEVGYSFGWPQGEPSVNGLSPALLGVKYRFVDEEKSGIAISTYPQIGYRGFATVPNAEISDPGTHIFLPIEFTKAFGKFAVNPELGFDWGSQVPNLWVYGLVLAYEFGEEKEALFELHARNNVDFDSQELLFNVGSRYLIGAGKSLIFSVGHSLLTLRGDQPFLSAYLGIQLRI